jgi:hypothetical protein
MTADEKKEKTPKSLKILGNETTEIPSAENDEWILAESVDPDSPMILRFRPNLESSLGDPRYPRRLVVTWQYESADEGGMPTEEQSDEMQNFEDTIVAALDPERFAILTFVVTGEEKREWHYYVDNVDEVAAIINEALADSPELPISLEVEEDPDWEEFREVLECCVEVEDA